MKTNKYKLTVLLLLVFVTRMAFVILFFTHYNNQNLDYIFKTIAPKHMREERAPEDILESDAGVYDKIAQNFASGNGLEYPFNTPEHYDVVAPGYPVFLGFLYWMFGRNLWVSLSAYALLDTLTALIFVLLIKQSFNKYSDKISSIFLILFAFYIPYIVNILEPITECLFTFLIALFFLVYKKGEIKRSKLLISFSGIILGLCALTRPIVLIFPFWLLIFQIITRYSVDKKTIFLNFAILFVMLCITLSPWVIRNFITYDKLILVNTQPNLVVMGTDLKSSAGEINSQSDSANFKYIESKNKPFVETFTNIIISFLKEPSEYLKLWAVKFTRLWLNIGFENKPSTGSIITAIFHTILLILFVFSIIKYKYIFHELFIPINLIFYTTFFHVIFFTSKLRFVIPLLPIILLITAVFLNEVFKLRKPEKLNYIKT